MAKIVTTRKVSVIAVVFLLCLVFLAFAVAGDDAPAESAPQTAVENSESASVVSGSDGSVYASIDQVAVVSDTAEQKELANEEAYADIDQVEQVSGEVPVQEEIVYLDLENVSDESSYEIPTEDAERTQSFTGLVNVGGEPEVKEVMKVRYLESQAEVVSQIERREEVVLQNGEQLKKEVVVSSNEHFDNEIVYKSYLGVEVADRDQIQLNWKTENRELTFETHDENGNGLIDSISWIIPHLSEQEFEITVNLESWEDPSAYEISIQTLSSPASMSDSSVSFEFNVSYSNLSLLVCNFTIVRNSSGKVVNERSVAEGQIDYNLNLSNGNYSWSFDCFDLGNESVHEEVNGGFLVNANYFPAVGLTATSQNITRGQIVAFGVNVSAPPRSEVYLIKYKLNYGDGSEPYNSDVFLGQEFVADMKSHNYTSAGVYSVNLTGSVQYSGDSPSLIYTASAYKTIVVNEPASTADSEGPKIRLNEPADEESFSFESKEQKIKFSYNVTDNVKIANCTFEMFYYNDSIFGEEIITEFKNDISNGSTISYEYKDFDDGDYSWDVECYDNSSNRGTTSSRDFSVYYDENDDDSDSGSKTVEKKAVTLSSADQAKSDEVQELIDAINDFMVEEEKYDSKQVEAISDLEIDENLKFYKKKLLQMKLDLGHNLDYINEQDRKEARKQEIYQEMDKMRAEIPVSLEVKDSKDYFKSSSELNLEEIISAYVEAKGIVIDKNGIREMAKQNELLQNKITVSVNTKSLVVNYVDGNEEKFVLVSKKIDFKDREFDGLIEVIPKEVAESSDDLSFVVSSNVLKKDPIIEIKLSDFGDREKLVYKINKDLPLSGIEGTTTLAFKEEIPESKIGGVSGFVSLVGGGVGGGFGFYLSWILVIAAVVFVGMASYKKVQIGRLKKHKDVRALFAITSETERLLKAMEIEKARERYHEAQTLYPKIPEHGKKFVYRKLQKLYLSIDKKDITSMVKEFIAASKDGRKGDAIILYGNIQKLYPRMPKGFREKVFEKMQPHLERLKEFKG